MPLWRCFLSRRAADKHPRPTGLIDRWSAQAPTSTTAAIPKVRGITGLRTPEAHDLIPTPSRLAPGGVLAGGTAAPRISNRREVGHSLAPSPLPSSRT